MFRRGLRARQPDDDRGPVAGRGEEVHVAAVRLHDPAHEREAEPHAAGAPIAAGVAPVEGLEGALGHARRRLDDVQANGSITPIAYDLSSLTGDKDSIDIHSSTDVNTVVTCGEV